MKFEELCTILKAPNIIEYAAESDIYNTLREIQ